MNAGQIIWSQISIGTKMACGARQAVAGEDRLYFRVLESTKLRKIIVTLTAMDDYNVELVTINRRTWETKVEESHEGIYADQLSNVIYKMCNK